MRQVTDYLSVIFCRKLTPNVQYMYSICVRYSTGYLLNLMKV